jgi:hypothetical protein
MSAATVAQTLALDEVAVSGFSGSGDEFAEFFAVSYTEGAWAVSQLTPPATVPDAPSTAPTAVGGVGEATVTYAAVTGDGGSPITGYEVVVGNGAAQPLGASPATVTGIAPGDWAVRYRAVNAIGAGPWSPTSNVFTVT